MFSQDRRFVLTNELDQVEQNNGEKRNDAKPQFLSERNFLYALLSVPARFLCADYREIDLAAHMHAFGIPNSFIKRKLPISHESASKYFNAYAPLLFFNCWADLVSELHTTSDVDPDHYHHYQHRSPEKDICVSGKIETDRVLGRLSNFEILQWDPKFITVDVLLSATESIETILNTIGQKRPTHGGGHKNNRTTHFDDEEWLTAFERDPFNYFNSIALLMIAPPVGFDDEPNTVGVCRTEALSPTDEIGQKMMIAYGTGCALINPLKHIYRYTFHVANNDKNWEILNKKSRMIVQGIAYIRPTFRYLRSMQKISEDPDFVGTLLNPSIAISALNCERSGRTIPNFFFNSYLYNEHQRAAVIGALNLVHESNRTSRGRIAMIQGPPGTGKTRTLTGIVQNILLNCESNGADGGGGARRAILICAPSNGAIDEVAIRLITERKEFEHYFGRPLRLIRIGPIDKIRPEVSEYTLNAQVRKCRNSQMKINGVVEDNYAKIVNHLLERAHVLLTTLGSSQSNLLLRSCYAREGFRCVIVDEASQCIEPELMMPIAAYGSLDRCKLIMIGDHQQLPATVISPFAGHLNYGRSLLERLHLRYNELIAEHSLLHDEEIPNPMLTLCEQFRMREEICAFPSKQFYENRLLTPAGTGINAAIPLRPFGLFNITNSEEKIINASKSNPIEAQFILELVLTILSRLDINFDVNNVHSNQSWRSKPITITIGIITFYQNQKTELLRKFTNFWGGILPRYIEINTVDSFQGRESDIVILSCVRALPLDRIFSAGCGGLSGGIGFVRSAQRMNVAITRAKSSLFVCMHGASFRNEPNWRQMIEDAKRGNNWININFQQGSSLSHESSGQSIELLKPMIDANFEPPTCRSEAIDEIVPVDNDAVMDDGDAVCAINDQPVWDINNNNAHNRNDQQECERKIAMINLDDKVRGEADQNADHNPPKEDNIIINDNNEKTEVIIATDNETIVTIATVDDADKEDQNNDSFKSVLNESFIIDDDDNQDPRTPVVAIEEQQNKSIINIENNDKDNNPNSSPFTAQSFPILAKKAKRNVSKGHSYLGFLI